MFFELKRHGFELGTTSLIWEDVMVHRKSWLVREKGNNVVLRMNDGYMCKDTLKELFAVKLVGDSIKERGLLLAKAFVKRPL